MKNKNYWEFCSQTWILSKCICSMYYSFLIIISYFRADLQPNFSLLDYVCSFIRQTRDDIGIGFFFYSLLNYELPSHSKKQTDVNQTWDKWLCKILFMVCMHRI